MIKIVLAATSDIVTDNRLHKVATTLSQNGYQVTLVGRRFKTSSPLFSRDYFTRRFKLWFNKSSLFYLNYNARLLVYLLKVPVDIIVSNDLDTLLACSIAAKLRRKVLVYDSHEMFVELPELVNRKLVKGTWSFLEKLLVPGIKFGYTVSQPIADYYKNKYNKDFELVRNVGHFRFDLQYKPDFSGTILIYQGAVNVGRGIDLMIKSMAFIDDAKLWVIGSGDVLGEMKQLAQDLQLEDKVMFFGRIRLDDLWEYTQKGHIGFSLEEDLGLNYRYALPNKIFDYIQARVPMVVSNLPEMSKLVEKYHVGEVLRNRTPEALAAIVNNMRENKGVMPKISQKLELAARDLCWQREEEKLTDLYRQACELISANNA